MPFVKSAKNSVTTLLVTCGLFAVYGYAYEKSYFMTLGLKVEDVLSLRHYIYSGFWNTVLPLLAIVACALLIKFFSKTADQNDMETFVKVAKDAGFSKSLKAARLALLACVIYWFAAIFENRVFDNPHAVFIYPWVLLLVLQTFAASLYTSPPHSRIAVLFAFFLATSLCLSASGISSARFEQSPRFATSTHLRDDGIVRVTRASSGFKAEAKPWKLPLPMLEKAIASVIGE